MDSRRDFLKKAAMLSGSVGFASVFPPSIQRALAIEPDAGTTFYDAEHVVLLMQENRSFDHCFGSLRGVRGFNDPRALKLPNNLPVWLQTNKNGESFLPFHLDIKGTKATWTGDLPHAWEDQVDARNQGRYDKWLEAKVPHKAEFKHLPLTMGYYNRSDIPFYYSLADAFTVFDQHFCSSLTGTTTNRLFFWSGTHKASAEDVSHVRNSEVNFDHEAGWKTFPERLEEAGVSWKVYQNEISLENELKGEDAGLLGNFADNNLEWFSQYNVRYAASHRSYLLRRTEELPGEIAGIRAQMTGVAGTDLDKLQETLRKLESQLERMQAELVRWSPENFEKLSDFEKNLHNRAFVTNAGDPDYHSTEELHYAEDGVPRSVKVPKGDILHQFRKDVENGELPAVSWVVAPGKFSDHPSAPWYGAWYVSEVMDILTKNPEVWKKTIFILTYDENDGYFDHVPPFVAPDPSRKEAFSAGVDATTEYVTREEEIVRKGVSPENAREHAVGLGYRVPMVVASPWSRGGWVNSQVCDITSTIMLMENWLTRKTGKAIKEDNISTWRRTVCSDLTSAFQKTDVQHFRFDEFLNRDAHMQAINNASFKPAPSNFQALSAMEIEKAKVEVTELSGFPKQEKGTKSACALPYELYVHGQLLDQGGFVIEMNCSKALFGENASGAPFNIYALNEYRQPGSGQWETRCNWSYAVAAGDTLKDQWETTRFKDDRYGFEVFGPNGFYRMFSGERGEAPLHVSCQYLIKKKSVQVILDVWNQSDQKLVLQIKDVSYGGGYQMLALDPGKKRAIGFDVAKNHNWYDLELTIEGNSLWKRKFAGRVETGIPTRTDPVMGQEV